MNIKAVFLASLCLPLLSGCKSSVHQEKYDNADKYLIGSHTYEERIDSISVEWICGKVDLVEDETITGAKLEEDTPYGDKEKVHSYFADGKLDVRFMESNHRAYIESKYKVLKLTFNPNLDKFAVSVTSGELTLNRVSANDVSLTATSGKIEVGTIVSSKTYVKATSGDIQLSNVVSEETSFEMTSGSISTGSIAAKNFKFNATSGSSAFKFDALENGEVKFTSGSSKVKMPESGAKVGVEKTSGSVNASEKYSSFGSTYSYGDESSVLRIEMTSGSIYLS